MLKRVPLELIFWLAALVLLAMEKPVEHGHEPHFTLCPLANIGFEWCPGCGIGRSITQLLHGNASSSLDHHWFGIPGLAIILYRSYVLVKLNIRNKKEFKLI